MTIFSDKNKIIKILFTLAVIFLIANLVMDKVTTSDKTTNLKNENPDIINVKFLNTLSSFGLQKDWIKVIRKSPEKEKSAFSYSVAIPKDLPIAVILEQIYKTFDTTNVHLDSREKVIGGETVLKIFSGKNLELFADFNYSEDISRNAGSAGFLITGINQLNKKDITEFIKSSESFAIVLVPSKVSAQIVSELAGSRKEYVVELNDDINEINLRLRKSYSHYRLNNAIRAIIGNYSKAAFFVINSQSEIYNSLSGKFIANQFAKRKIKLIPTDSLIQLNTGRDREIVSSFESIMRDTKRGDYKLIMIPAEKFTLLKPDIVRLRKIGYKFVNPSIVLSKKK